MARTPLFEKKIPRVHTSIFYQITLLLVAVFMIALPLLYLLMIAGVAYGVYEYAVQCLPPLFTQFMPRSLYLKLMVGFVYLIPLLTGILVVFFFLKPLFAHPGKQIQPRILKPEDEPALYDFVRQLCKAVRAPMPRRIRLDCQVNASAGPTGGLFSILFRNLTLTIGVPLIAGMNLRQFTGILAHELGHFSQGGGMMFSFIIQNINFWFARVVYERDSWDEHLLMQSHSDDWKQSLLCNITRLCVWISRRVLWVLMQVGRLVSCFLLRQMEFDADRYEARLAGSEVFEQTARQLMQLELAWGKTKYSLEKALAEKKLCDSLPLLVVANTTKISEEIRLTVDAMSQTEKTGFFDTHPAMNIRIARARKENAPGIFHDERPAASLFSQFEKHCKSVTLDFYAGTLGAQVSQVKLITTQEFLKQQQAQVDAVEAVSKLLFDCIHPDRPLPFGPEDIAAPENPNAMLQSLQQVRAYFALNAPNAAPAYERLAEVRELDLYAFISHEVLSKKLAFHPPRKDVKQLRTKIQDIRQETEIAIAPCEDALSKRLVATISLLHLPALDTRLPDRPQILRQALRLIHALHAYRQALPHIFEVRHNYHFLTFILSQLGEYTTDESVVDRIHAVTRNLALKAKNALSHMNYADYPFQHASQNATLGGYLMEIPPETGNTVDTLGKTGEMLDRLAHFFACANGELAQIVDRVEQAMGLPPLSVTPLAKNTKEQ